jgi:hypothetical protein
MMNFEFSILNFELTPTHPYGSREGWVGIQNPKFKIQNSGVRVVG